ncbi:MAG: PA14 domain-containing protein [Planctomycetota bacterium]|nr:PA14 domain-containing protein [Planctomycetota bacterium]
MGARPCDFCGTPITEQMLAGGQAREIMKEYFCAACIQKYNLDREEEDETEAPAEAAPAPHVPPKSTRRVRSASGAHRPSARTAGRTGSTARRPTGVRPGPSARAAAGVRAPSPPAGQAQPPAAPAPPRAGTGMRRSTPIPRNLKAVEPPPAPAPAPPRPGTGMRRSTPVPRDLKAVSGPGAAAPSPPAGTAPRGGAGLRRTTPIPRDLQAVEGENKPDIGSGDRFVTQSGRQRRPASGGAAQRGARSDQRLGPLPPARGPTLTYVAIGVGCLLLALALFLVFKPSGDGQGGKAKPNAEAPKDAKTETRTEGAKTGAAQVPTPKVVTPAPYAGEVLPRNGLLARYYSGLNAAGEAVLARLDPNVDYVWNLDAPAPEVPKNEFSAEWTGLVKAKAAGTYTFATRSDDGTRLWLGGQLLVDAWDSSNPGILHEARAELEAGKHYELKLRYFDEAGDATCRLFWQPPGGTLEPIPAASLVPPADVAVVLNEGPKPPVHADKPPEPGDDEVAAFLISDEDIDADTRESRRAWRLARGQPQAGAADLLVAGFETSEELLAWSFRPRKDVLAWMGRRGVAEGEYALRLAFEPKSLAFAASDFHLALGSDQKWDWSGAKRVRVECLNPDPSAELEIALVVRGGDVSTDASGQQAVWPFKLAPNEKKTLAGDLEGKGLDLSDLRWIGFRVTRREGRATVVYLDNLVVEGVGEVGSSSEFRVPSSEFRGSRIES